MAKIRDDYGMTFDDVLLVPKRSDVLPDEVDVTTKLTNNIALNIPILSSAMDTVTEAELAIALAREGGIGIIHRNLEISKQAREVLKVKRSESGMIIDPITLPPDKTIADAMDIMAEYRISGVPVTTGKGKLVGILTNRDLRFERDLSKKIEEVMTKENLVTVPEGTSLDEAIDILHKHRIEKLLVVDDDGHLKGLITVKDIMKRMEHPNACKDHLGRLRVGAAVGTGPDTLDRVSALKEAGVDCVVVDTAHGHSTRVLEVVEKIKGRCPDVEIVAGNVCTREATRELIEKGADAVKVGIGPSAICTTRVIAGIGLPQITAIMECTEEADKHSIPVIADGGIKYSGDITKAIAAGASSVMIGSIFAGTDESPGEEILYEGRRFKVYYGMGSLAAMKTGRTKDRYFQEGRLRTSKLVPEGIEGRVPYKGPLADVVYQLVGGLRAGMGYVGARDIETLRTKSEFIRISHASLVEGHPHDVIITREAPNYGIG
ncbi:MAG: IMP dehydrogenase [Candidatus Coatesbacteria bacterium]|nr:MAG: IMP dehydrogenase [Candidatus Coatesbacteria bacterium]RLC41869.1 MAG: IMP dehydrogenase [Candidatus Coatesbacteria bacterium]